MRRLRDEGGDDPVAVRGIEVLRGTPPAARSPESKRRVWNAIQRADAAKGARFRLPRLSRAAGVIAVITVVGSAGTVIAARHWIAPIFRRASPAPSAPVRDRKPPIGRPVTLRRASTSASLPMAAGPELQEQTDLFPAPPVHPAPAPAPAPARAPVRKVAPGRRLSTSPTSPARSDTSGVVGALGVPAAAPVRERAEVLDAMVALRRDRDPVTAGRMLDTYLTAHPTGALREEALVLAIEAGAARGDLTFVRSLAHQYQAAYPTGRFREFARAAAGR